MAITNGYTDLETYKQRFYDADHQQDTEDDAAIESAITAVSRAIEDITWRRFYATTETRYYTAQHSDYLKVDDLLDISGVTGTLKTDHDGDRTYEYTWATTDYDLMPYNASLDGTPYTWIETTPDGDYWFPVRARKGVEIKGSFGYSSTTPPAIQEACLLATHRLMKRADTPLGVSANTNLGQVNVIIKSLSADPDIMNLLDPYIRRI